MTKLLDSKTKTAADIARIIELREKKKYLEVDDPLRPAKGFFWNLIIAVLFWIIAALFFFTYSAQANLELDYASIYPLARYHGDFRGYETKAEKFIKLGAFVFIDYQQSVQMFFHRKGYYETNPILGKHPSRHNMLLFGVVGITATYILSELLPPKWSTIFIDSVLSSEQYNIEDNDRIMKGMKRRFNGVPIIITVRF